MSALVSTNTPLIAPMAEPQLLQDRLISGKGVLQIPTDVRKTRTLTLYCDVVRPPSNKYTNVNYNPPRGRLGTVVFLRNEYVIAEMPIEYDRQAFDGINDICGQTLLAVKCAYAGTLTSFNRLATALGIAVLPETDLIKDFESLQLSWIEARVTCYADTALQLRLFGTDYDSCTDDNIKTQPPPPPPPPVPRVQPRTPITNLSPPYNGDDNDGGNTNPFDGDEFEMPPPTLPDNSTLKWNLSTSLNPRTTFAQAVFTTFTPVSNYSVTGGNVDAGANAKEWLATFTSGTSTVNGSAVGTLTPEDKPSLYLWDINNTNEPYRVLTP